jgi:hydroxylamine dehydrogenase
MKAIPTIHWQPMAMTQGEKGGGGCHKIGDKTITEIVELRQNGSGTEFDAAHPTCLRSTMRQR